MYSCGETLRLFVIQISPAKALQRKAFGDGEDCGGFCRLELRRASELEKQW
jgi:hypothetical protein